jgi:hypothetical protein
MGRFLLVLHPEKFDQFACAALGSGRPFLPSPRNISALTKSNIFVGERR